MTYQESLDWLYSTQNFGIKLGLDAPKKLLRHFFAQPARGVQVAHIAGTNGKGSTCAILDSIARASGKRSGLFTSPHLIDFRERVRINGEMISEAQVARYLTEIRETVQDWEHHPTFFELTLVLAMRHFRDSECELIILETGMGGRLDATTAVPADICAITPIALDHSEWLGDTIEKVASEKAGIILEAIPVITAAQDSKALQVIAEEAAEKRAPLTKVSGPLLGYHISLAGAHQAANAKLAVEIATQLDLALNFDLLQYALGNTQWPGRFETVSKQPHIIIDGAHNPHAARALVDTWKTQFPEQKATLVFGAVEEKDISPVLELLCSISDDIHLTPIDSPRSFTTEAIQSMLPTEALSRVHIHSCLTACLSHLQDHSKPILIAGSLFLIGEAKSILGIGGFQRSSQ